MHLHITVSTNACVCMNIYALVHILICMGIELYTGILYIM